MKISLRTITINFKENGTIHSVFKGTFDILGLDLYEILDTKNYNNNYEKIENDKAVLAKILINEIYKPGILIIRKATIVETMTSSGTPSKMSYSTYTTLNINGKEISIVPNLQLPEAIKYFFLNYGDKMSEKISQVEMVEQKTRIINQMKLEPKRDLYIFLDSLDSHDFLVQRSPCISYLCHAGSAVNCFFYIVGSFDKLFAMEVLKEEGKHIIYIPATSYKVPTNPYFAFNSYNFGNDIHESKCNAYDISTKLLKLLSGR